MFEIEGVVSVECFHEQRSEVGGDIANPLGCIMAVEEAKSVRVHDSVEL